MIVRAFSERCGTPKREHLTAAGLCAMLLLALTLPVQPCRAESSTTVYSSFAGISNILLSPGSDPQTRVISFDSDSPFQYKIILLDSDHVTLRLYKADFARNLIDANGAIPRLRGLGIASARLTKPTMDQGYCEIQLAGTGIGTQPMTIEGADALIDPARFASTNTESVASNSTPDSDDGPDTNAGGVHLSAAKRDSPQIAMPVDEAAEATQATLPDGSPAAVSAPAKPAAIGPKLMTATMTDRNGQVINLQSKPLPQTYPMTIFAHKPAPKAVDGEKYNALFQDEAAGDSTQKERNALQAQTQLAKALTAFKKGQFTEAEKAMQTSVALDPQNPSLRAALGEIQIKNKHLDAARLSYALAAQRNPAQYQQRYAQILVQTGKRADAIRVLSALLKRPAPPAKNSITAADRAQTTYMIGTLHEELGHPGEALPYLQKAATLSPRSGDVQYNLGLAYELTGNKTLARTHYQRAQTLTPKAPDVHKALLRLK